MQISGHVEWSGWKVKTVIYLCQSGGTIYKLGKHNQKYIGCLQSFVCEPITGSTVPQARSSQLNLLNLFGDKLCLSQYRIKLITLPLCISFFKHKGVIAVKSSGEICMPVWLLITCTEF